jgi:FkbH-like protein
VSAVNLTQLRGELPALAYNDCLRRLPEVEAAVPDGAPLRVAVLRSYTVEPLEPILKLWMLADGYRPSFLFGGFNQYAQEVLDPVSPLYRFEPQVVLFMVRIEELVPDFIDAYGSHSPAEWRERLDAKASAVAGLAAQVARTTSAQVFIQNATLQRGYFGIFDAQGGNGQVQLVQRFNQRLADAASATSGVFVWDFDALVRVKGLENLVDPKQWYVARNPFKLSAYPVLAADLHRYVRAALGRVAKCVVLDLDNTLWGGVAGEDGLEGVKLGHTYPGNCFRDFQKELLKLYERGILLALNSKNNEEDALRIIDEHPDMVLRRQHFAARRINWADKASNLRAIASELNIGADSLIFVDDNPVECELIRQHVPECEVVLLPDKPYLLPAQPQSWARIENIRLTTEDRRRGEMYRAQVARKEDEDRYTSIDEFLHNLQIEVELEPATSFSIPRIAQLTQKTNQWNMTTRRYTEAEVQAFVSDTRHAVLTIAARDRFGDEGIVGACILRFDGPECVIDTFLLSCRVIGRGIEQSMLARAAELARERGATTLVGEFIPTKKNKPAEGFYERAGFEKGDGYTLRASVNRAAFPFPAHIRIATANRHT